SDNEITSTTVREVALGEGVVACSVDDQGEKLYWSQSDVGLLSLNSDEEKDEERRLLAAVSPAGSLDQAPTSLQVLPASGSILATTPDPVQVVLYSPEGSLLSSANLMADANEDVTSVAVLNNENGQWHWWAMTDEGKQMLSGNSDSLATLTERETKGGDTYNVLPVVQTDVVDSYGDAADDPEVWVNSQDASRSLIVATDKKQGLWTYNLKGEKQQFLPRGNVNNVDVRYNFDLQVDGETRPVDLAVATNRSTENLDVFAIDQQTGELTFVAGDIMDGSLGHPYGGCLYTSRKTGQTYAFANNKDGLYQQWRLVAEGDTVHGEKVREFTLNGQPEGCVADDETGRLYAGEEDHGIWTLDLEAEGTAELKLMDETANGHLVADVEGISLYTGADGQGYVVVSSQGDNAYVLYDRKTNDYIGRFRIKANAELGIDGSSETDGLAVTSADLGGAFDKGLLVVQDGRNRMPAARQNFKLVSWDAVEAGLHQFQAQRDQQEHQRTLADH
ncbi:phytase, partial [Pseudomaricurvus sp.]|uniref:phytase n=1 Tax=Pseudomaricurvus sp. TaxID=2004510 RepID=UPI003F6C2F77